jgi:hypothetical protein
VTASTTTSSRKASRPMSKGLPGGGRYCFRKFSCPGPRRRRGRPPRNSKWLSLTTLAMESARPSQRTRANWRAESQLALYQTPGLSPG